ncbi:MAG: penicillin-binding protein 2, partial [Rickettsiales bacterium]|nr:penicillin-binding protein 2 [Rickettsiales bacterium]
MSRKMYRHTRRPASRIVRGGSRTTKIIEQNHLRLLVVMACFVCGFLMLVARLIEVGSIGAGSIPFKRLVTEPQLILRVDDPAGEVVVEEDPAKFRRPIVDRNGMVLASNIRSAALVANPTLIRDKQGVAKRLSRVLKGVNAKLIYEKINKPGIKFSYIKRHLTPGEQEKVNRLGVPGLFFETHYRRAYPFGKEFSHVLGYVDVDNKGLAGVERAFNQKLLDPIERNKPLALSLDARVQSVACREIYNTMKSYRAKGAAVIVADVDTGELLSICSLPSFDPHKPGKAKAQQIFNRASYGVYELGSTFKTFTLAMGLDKGVVTMKDKFDVSKPVRVGGYAINDDHKKHDWLSVPEIFAYSSNVGTVKIMMDVGADYQQEFLRKIGMFDRVDLEVPELASPLLPQEWRDINMMTISYGHGISVTPMHLVQGIMSVVNGGYKAKLSVLKQDASMQPKKERVMKEITSHHVRMLMRYVVQHGTAKNANVKGFRVGGKTGTAEKIENGRYQKDKKIASFVSVFPVEQP